MQTDLGARQLWRASWHTMVAETMHASPQADRNEQHKAK